MWVFSLFNGLSSFSSLPFLALVFHLSLSLSLSLLLDFFKPKSGPSNEVIGKFSPTPPTPEFLTKNRPPAARSRMEILTKEHLVGAKTAPTAVARTFTPFVRRIRFPL